MTKKITLDSILNELNEQLECELAKKQQDSDLLHELRVSLENVEEAIAQGCIFAVALSDDCYTILSLRRSSHVQDMF